MSWVTVIWSMISSACLTLAAIHFLVWFLGRQKRDDLLFAFTSAGIAAFAIGELAMMRAETPGQFAFALRWIHVPTWVIVVSLVGFVRCHLRAGRPWLAWAVFAARTAALILNFLVGQNLNYRQVTGLRHVSFLGQSVSVGVGVANPCMLVGQLSLLLLLAFVTDAAITVWRRGDRQAAMVEAFSIVFFALAGLLQAVLVLWQVVNWPLTASFFYLGIVVTMSYEVSGEMIRAAQTVRELKENEQRLALAADAANLGLWSRELAGDAIWATDRWRALFGFAQSDPLDLNAFLQKVHPDDRESLSKCWTKAIESRSGYDTEYRMVTADGQTRWIASHGRVELDGDGRPFLMRGASLDITERRRLEVESADLRQGLAHAGRVTMLGQLASSLAHELGQPLGAILRNAETAEILLQEASPDIEELRAIVSDICKDNHRAGDVIDRLRSLLKRRSLESHTLELGQLVDEVVALLRSDVHVRRVKLEINVPATLPPVRGDRVHLQQVLLNLIINAMDAVDAESDSRRRVKLHAQSNGNGMIEIAVSDSGHGVPEGKLERLFDPFFTTKTNGMGMGLSISRTIVEAHGGRIWAENNPDRGTTFRFTLSRATARDAR